MKYSLKALALTMIALISLTAIPEATAQRGRKDKGKKSNASAPKGKADKSDIKSMKELTESCNKIEGLFTLYSDTTNGKGWMAIPDSMLEKPFIYFSHVEDGVAESGYTRGSYRNSKVITFHKHFDRIEIHAENTNYYFDLNLPWPKRKEANINTPIIASLNIEGIDSIENGLRDCEW